MAALTAACTAEATDGTVGPATTTTESSVTSPAPEATTTPTTTTTTTTTTEDADRSPGLDADVIVPSGEGPFPAVVLVHGGGWVAGSPGIMTGLAEFLGQEGYLTVNTAYTLSGETAGFPAAVDDVACAVRFAAAHPDGDGSVAVIGHSAGAHLGALVALDDGGYGEGCPEEEPAVPDRFVGLAGPYDVTRLGPLMIPFFGAGPRERAEAWVEGNPMEHAEENRGLQVLLLHGQDDQFVDYSFASDFADVLAESGKEVIIEVVEGARHTDMQKAEFVGDLVVTWLDRQIG